MEFVQYREFGGNLSPLVTLLFTHSHFLAPFVCAKHLPNVLGFLR
jgi:hypothetical protein